MGGTGTLSAERPTARPAGPFVDRLQAAGFDFFVGVPCSLVGPVIAELERRGLYLPETREDAPEHLVMGRVLPDLLDVFRIPHRAPVPDTIEADVAWAASEIRERRTPVALVILPGLFA